MPTTVPSMNKLLWSTDNYNVSDTNNVTENHSENTWNGEPQHNAVFLSFAAGLLILIIVVAIIGNMLVAYAFVVESRLRTLTNFFILNLALADLITACSVMTFEVDLYLKNFRWDHGPAMCEVWKTLYLFSTPASIINLCAISIDRYIALLYPLRYDILVTSPRVFIALASVWLYSLIVALFPVLGWKMNMEYSFIDESRMCIFTTTYEYNILITILNYILPPLVMCVLWIKIYLIARDHAHRIAKIKSSLNPSSGETLRSTDVSINPKAVMRRLNKEPTSARISFSKKVKGSKYIALIIIVFFVCWLPFSFLSIISNFWVDIYYWFVPPDVYTAFILFGYANSALNPFLYGLHSQYFQKVYKKVWKCVF